MSNNKNQNKLQLLLDAEKEKQAKAQKANHLLNVPMSIMVKSLKTEK